MTGKTGSVGDSTYIPPKENGWEPAQEGCEEAAIRPPVVLDPFGGAGTTGLVADKLGCDSILIEINPEYAEIARKRIELSNPMFSRVVLVS